MPNQIDELKKERSINLSLIKFYESSRLPLKRYDANRLKHLKDKVEDIERQLSDRGVIYTNL